MLEDLLFDLLFWELEGPKLSVSPPDVSAHLEMRKIRKMNKNPKLIEIDSLDC